MRNDTLRFRLATWFLLHTPNWMLQILIVFAGFVIYPVISVWLASCSEEHEWISSFIEVSIALNSAMLVTDLREWFVGKFKSYSKVFGGVAISRISIQRNDMMLARLSKKMYATEKPLSDRLRKVARLFSFVGIAAIVVGCIVLLTDCNKSNMKYIPLLVWPFVLFYFFLVWQFLWALNVSRKYCIEVAGQVLSTASVGVFRMQIEKISKSVPKIESEE